MAADFANRKLSFVSSRWDLTVCVFQLLQDCNYHFILRADNTVVDHFIAIAALRLPSPTSLRQVDEELRVFKYNKSDWELGELEELEEFSSFDVVT